MDAIATKKPDTTNNHLANERTFLAWIRSSISIIVFGFVVSKFGIALREFFLVQGHQIKESNDSLIIGVVFMGIGIILALTSMIRYQITKRRIDMGCFQPANLMVILLGLFAAFFGMVLMIYLIVATKSI